MELLPNWQLVHVSPALLSREISADVQEKEGRKKARLQHVCTRFAFPGRVFFCVSNPLVIGQQETMRLPFSQP